MVLISGVIDEELAIETLKLGATDYVLKQRLDRLVPVVLRALRESEERRRTLVRFARRSAKFAIARTRPPPPRPTACRSARSRRFTQRSRSWRASWTLRSARSQLPERR